jgi:hypothetical protein
MGMDIRSTGRLAAALLTIASGCATQPPALDVRDEAIALTVDNPANPRHVRFDVPTALILGNAGDDRLPVTLRARVATRDLAARELASRGYCPLGFEGPEGIHFPDGNRAHSAFTVRCIS